MGCKNPQDQQSLQPEQSLSSTFFGLNIAYGPSPPEEDIPWPDDVEFGQYQTARFWLAGGGLWADVHKSRGGDFDWSFVDTYMSKTTNYDDVDKTVIYVIAMTPQFAVAEENRSHLCAWPELYPGGCNPPDDWNDPDQGQCLEPASDYVGPNCTFKEFLVALVRRYRGSGVQDGCEPADPHCHGVIHYYQMNNEINSYKWPQTRFWTGTARGTEDVSRDDAYSTYARMILDAAEVIRREDPSARIIGPSFYGADGAESEFFYGQEDIDLSDAIDILSFHSYGNTWEEHQPEEIRPIIQEYLDARERVSRIYPDIAEKPLWATEGGWGKSAFYECEESWANCIEDPHRQAAYLARWFLHHWDMGIGNASWYSWSYSGWGEIWCPSGSASHDHNVGCDELASEEPQPTIAGVAFQHLHSWLIGSSRSGLCEQNGDIRTCPITNPVLPSGHGIIAWDENESGNRISVPDEFGQYWTLDGSVHIIENGEAPVGIKPILIN